MSSPTTSKPFVISRTFVAPRTLVWDAWTKPEHLARWMSPKGMAPAVTRMDLRPGGCYHYSLKMPQGGEMWGKWVLREVVPPERLVWEHAFSNPEGGLTRHPMAPNWPLQMLSVATFAEAAVKTTVTLHWTTLNATPSEQKTFDDAHGGMTGGWTGTFEQLEAYLAEVQGKGRG